MCAANRVYRFKFLQYLILDGGTEALVPTDVGSHGGSGLFDSLGLDLTCKQDHALDDIVAKNLQRSPRSSPNSLSEIELLSPRSPLSSASFR